MIWGDDQHENFTEDIIPPFCVLAYDRIEARHRPRDAGRNVWGEDAETVFRIPGHREAGKFLARRLLEQDIDVSYAYAPLHHPGLAHAFLNTIMYLDYDRGGFPYPVLAFQVNCYGRRVIAQRGGRASLERALADADLDPPSPTPKRCMDVGAATARAMREIPWRTALIASSSWSHAFLTDKHHQLYPDIEADQRLYEALRRGDYETWRATPLAAIEASGQQEMLNWYMLAGAWRRWAASPTSASSSSRGSSTPTMLRRVQAMTTIPKLSGDIRPHIQARSAHYWYPRSPIARSARGSREVLPLAKSCASFRGTTGAVRPCMTCARIEARG